jgi:outer membrane protein OmpA-like peptidoglycan-associated protein
MNKLLLNLFLLAIVSNACVSQKQYAALKAENERLLAAGPISEAKKETEATVLNDLRAELKAKDQQLIEVQRTMEKHRMLEAAASLPQPTPEQMEMYRMQNQQAIQESESGLLSQAYQSDFQQDFMAKEMEYRILHDGLKKALEDYPTNQVNFMKSPGQLMISLSPEALFDENKTNINSNGASILNKISAALKGEELEDFEVIVIPVDPKSKSPERGQAVYDYMKSTSGAKNSPKSLLQTDCKSLNGGAEKECDHVFLRFRQDYQELMDGINQSMYR